jgi:quercetin dioxygenase-like cupin family protein
MRNRMCWLVGLTMILPIVAEASGKAEIVGISPGELGWERTAEGVAFAPLSGDRFKEAYFAMVRLPAGLVSPVHTKSANMFGLVVEGTLVNTLPEGAEGAGKPLGPGSYYKIPAGLAHVSKCVSQSDCVTLLHQDGAFDFHPVSR